MPKFIRGATAAAKLTLEQVQEMRRHYRDGATQGDLSRYYGVSIGQVGRIVRGESWQSGVNAGKGSQADIDSSQARLAAMLGVADLADVSPPGASGIFEDSPLTKLQRDVAKAKEREAAGGKMLEELEGSRGGYDEL